MIVKQFVSYVGVGVINTGMGLAVIFLLMAASIDPKISNVVGYLCGLVTSFELNRRFVFRECDARVRLQGARFLLAFGLSYGANFFTLSILLNATEIDRFVAQVASAAVYVGVFFLLSKMFVFRNRSSR